MKNKFFKEIIFIIISGLLINLFCVFLFFFPSHAAGNENVIYFPMVQNENGHFTDIVKSSIDNYLDSENYYIFAEYWAIENNWFVTYYVRWPKEDGIHVFSEIYNNGYQFSLYRSPSGYSGISVGYLRINMSDGTVGAYTSTFDHFYSLGSSSYYAGCDYVSNFQLYTNNTDNRSIVLIYNDGTIPTGEARKPFFNHNPEYAINDQAPTQVPESPTINNYTWNTYNNPPIDNTNELTLLESIWDSIIYNFVYLIDGIHGEIYTLIGNLTLYFDYIGDTISYYGDLIIGNIQDFANNFYENMAALVQPILESVNAISNPDPVDTDAVNEVIEETSIYGLVSLGDSLYSEFSDFFDDIEEVHTLRFTIPYTILDYTDYIIVDFSWYDDIRSTILPWIVGFLYAGFGLALFRSIPSIIHGVSGILQKGG